MSGVLRIDRVVTRGTFASMAAPGTSTTTSGSSVTTSDVVIIDAAHQAQPIVDAVAGRNVTAVICTHGHNDHVTVAPGAWRAVALPGAAASRRRYAVEDDPSRGAVLGASTTVSESAWRALRSRSSHPRALTGVVLPVSARGRGLVLRRHPVQRWAGCHRTLFSDFPTIVDSIRDSAVHLARGDPGPHRARRRHHHRRRSAPSRRMDRAGALKSCAAATPTSTT